MNFVKGAPLSPKPNVNHLWRAAAAHLRVIIIRSWIKRLVERARAPGMSQRWVESLGVAFQEFEKHRCIGYKWGGWRAGVSSDGLCRSSTRYTCI